MNILLIDDHFCAREGMVCLLKQIFAELRVFEAENLDQGLAIAEVTPLNLVLLDVQLPGKDGLAGLAEFKQLFPNLCVTMFSGLDDRELVFEALRLGAMGFIGKSVSRQVFVEALYDVLAGKVYLPASVVGSGLTTGIPPECAQAIAANAADLGLTPREFEVLGWLVRGLCNKEIARRLAIEEQTVKNHLRPIFRKFGVARRAELMVRVFERGIAFGRPEVGN